VFSVREKLDFKQYLEELQDIKCKAVIRLGLMLLGARHFVRSCGVQDLTFLFTIYPACHIADKLQI
jgi:hypothetical protein